MEERIVFFILLSTYLAFFAKVEGRKIIRVLLKEKDNRSSQEL